MSRSVLGALRALLIVLFAGALATQAASGLLAGLVGDGAQAVVLATLIVAGALCVEVVLVCVWMLVAMIRQDTLFDDRGHADRWVDVAIGALVAGAVCAAGGAVAAVIVQAVEPDSSAWGLAVLAVGACGVSAALALLVAVMRRLLHTAIGLRSELAEVV